MALGEPLNPAEQAVYQSGCQELEAEERLDGNLERLRKLRAQIAAAELPEATEFAQEQRLLHPLRDGLAAHIRADESTVQLEGLTATGRFHIAALRLNRPALIMHRQRRYLAVLLLEYKRQPWV